MAAGVSPKVEALLKEPIPAIMSTTRRDGSVETNPIWFEYVDGRLWVNGGTNRFWFKHLQRDPRVTLLFIDPKNMFRWAAVEGRMVNWVDDPGGDHINHLSHRYFGRDYQNPRTGRIKVEIEPLNVRGWGGR
ncbi:MAG TPA: pyridoxamine 5'-phosphate oxidase family protein [Candidatus Acidoferrum sp.]|nr:pyridoxamine 5'-phosphate oxidase family protein [Candidatus Acidoferrum sp.]